MNTIEEKQQKLRFEKKILIQLNDEVIVEAKGTFITCCTTYYADNMRVGYSCDQQQNYTDSY